MAENDDVVKAIDKLGELITKNKSDSSIDVLLARTGKDVEQHGKDLGELKEVVYKQHEPVIIWARNFMDSYRKVVTAVIISGLITLAGFLVQVYYLLQSRK